MWVVCWKVDGREIVFPFQAKETNFTSSQIVQTVFRAIQRVPNALSPEQRRLERQADHPLEFNDEFRNKWSYTANFPYVFIVCTGTNSSLHKG